MSRFHGGRDCVDPFFLFTTGCPKLGEIVVRFLQLRQSLLPYLYTLASVAHTTGVSLMRPMYLDWPDKADAYAIMKGLNDYGPSVQYMLGELFLVSTITTPMTEDNVTVPVSWTVWLPPGTWLHIDSSTVYEVTSPSGKNVTRSYVNASYPLFVRGGSLVPTLPPPIEETDFAGRASQVYTTLDWTIYPPYDTPGAFQVYEDDGITVNSEVALTNANYTHSNGQLTVLIQTQGTFDSSVIPSSRATRLLLPRAAVSSATIDGDTTGPCSETVKQDCFEAAADMSKVYVGPRNPHAPLTLVATLSKVK